MICVELCSYRLNKPTVTKQLKCSLFLWWQSSIFSIITQVLSVTWSFKNHSNMLICWTFSYQCWKHLNIFFNSMMHFFRILGIEVSKEHNLFKFCSIINVFAVTFDQFKGVLLCSFTKSWFCFGIVLEHATHWLVLGLMKARLPKNEMCCDWLALPVRCDWRTA